MEEEIRDKAHMEETWGRNKCGETPGMKHCGINTGEYTMRKKHKEETHAKKQVGIHNAEETRANKHR